MGAVAAAAGAAPGLRGRAGQVLEVLPDLEGVIARGSPAQPRLPGKWKRRSLGGPRVGSQGSQARGLGGRANARRRAGPPGVLSSQGRDGDPPGTCLLCLAWTLPPCPFRGPACPHTAPTNPQGTKADLRAGSVPVTNEPPSHCLPRPALVGGCSPKAGTGGSPGISGAGALPAVPGTVFSGNLLCFVPGLFVGESGPPLSPTPPTPKPTVPPL